MSTAPHPEEAIMKGTNTKFIFLVEDDLDDQELIIDAIMAQRANIKVKTATNGSKALSELETIDDDALPDLIVLDYNLPELNGSQILELLAKKTRYQDIPKVVWSTSNAGLYEEKCLRLGATAYLVKPSDLKGIQRLATQMIDLCETTA